MGSDGGVFGYRGRFGRRNVKSPRAAHFFIGLTAVDASELAKHVKKRRSFTEKLMYVP